VLELGSGPGFLERYIDSELITSERLFCRGVKLIADAQQMPVRDGALRAVVFTDVLHHLPRVREFFGEAQRCLRPNGVVVMIEPWVSRWATLVYGKLHHEPFVPDAAAWEFPPRGPLSGANGALPWIIFARDRARFEREFPHLRIEEIHPLMPLRYLVSGGVSLRALAPSWSYRLWKTADEWLAARADTWPMFALVVLRRT
jgi:SAM-dependent methyltransferase